MGDQIQEVDGPKHPRETAWAVFVNGVGPTGVAGACVRRLAVAGRSSRPTVVLLPGIGSHKGP
jgi:hypothetical protein